MASACVNKIGMSPESFLDCPPTATKYSTFGWLSPRISFSREFPDEEPSKSSPSAGAKPEKNNGSSDKESKRSSKKESDPGSPGNDFVDFEFRLEDPVNMLPADELFSDGKLVPMQLPVIRQSTASESTASLEVRSPDTPNIRRRGEISATDPYLFSPKAPRCSSRWKELLGLKKLYQNGSKQQQQELQKTTSSTSTHRTLKHLLQRSSKSSSLSSSLDSSLSLPLLRDGDSESVSISSSRMSLSSSSSGHEHEDFPRLSLDCEKPASSRGSHHNGGSGNGGTNVNLHRLRVVKSRALSAENGMAMRMGRSPIRKPAPEPSVRGVSVDSPRMNSSGKIVFHSLERSSSSPSSFNGGPRYKHRGMERSYSANVRVTPVLNVPVCSLRGSSKSGGVFGFPLFSSSSSSTSQQKKEKDSTAGGSGNSGSANGNRGQAGQQGIVKNRTDRN